MGGIIMEKEFRIQVPEGMEIDKENSTFECIKFKPIQKKRWRDDGSNKIEGYFITKESNIASHVGINGRLNYNVFATKKQAKSALSMARISQIMANDERFGGVITNEEWEDENMVKYAICRCKNSISATCCYYTYYFLSFHTAEQRDLFLKENEDLVKDYLMI